MLFFRIVVPPGAGRTSNEVVTLTGMLDVKRQKRQTVSLHTISELGSY
jgi:hypothetical protein